MKCAVLVAATFAAAIAAGVAAAPKPEETWPGFRGPGMNGVAPAGVSVPDRWSATQNVKWAVPIAGNEYIAEMQAQGVSNEEIGKRAAARDNELSAETEPIRYMVYALDAATG